MINMLEFLIDNICVSFGGTLLQQVVGIPMVTNCAPLLTDLFLYSYEWEFLQKLVKDKKIHEARASSASFLDLYLEFDAMSMQLVSFITCGCESNAPFGNLQSRSRTHAVLVIGLYGLLGNPTT